MFARLQAGRGFRHGSILGQMGQEFGFGTFPEDIQRPGVLAIDLDEDALEVVKRRSPVDGVEITQWDRLSVESSLLRNQ